MLKHYFHIVEVRDFSTGDFVCLKDSSNPFFKFTTILDVITYSGKEGPYYKLIPNPIFDN